MMQIPHNTPLPTQFNMAAHVLARADDDPSKIALSVLGQEDWTYRDLERAIRGIGTGLLQGGLRPGDRALMRLGNTPAFPMTYLACIAVGLVPVPTSSQLTGPEISKIAAEIKPALIIADTGITLPDHSAPVLSAQALTEFHHAPPCDWDLGDPNRPAYIIYTSGTSGQPRAVVHAHRAVWARRMMIDGWYGLRPDDRLLHAGAFNWTYTLGTGLMDPWAIGATALIPPAGTSAQDLPKMLSDHQATIFAAAPGVYRQMLRAQMPSLPQLRHGLSAGEKLPDGLRAQWTALTGTEIYEAYGMSECSTFVSASPSRPAPPGTLGYPQQGRQIALIADNGPADYGVIAVHRSDPGLMLGYLDRPEETAAKFSGDWFLTGDVASRQPGGALRYEGRNDDMMNAGGYRVSPVEVEEAMTTYPGLTEAAAVELTVKAETTVIALFYCAQSDLPESDLIAHASSRLARYKCPRLFLRVPQLPRGANNKLLRRALRQTWEAEHGQT